MTAAIHSSCVAFGDRGVLIRGAPGVGKSDLCLRLLHQKPAARLVADDQVVLTVKGGRLSASPPPALAGLMEIRGLGIVPVQFRKRATIVLVVDLFAAEAIPRLPEADDLRVEIEGLRLPRIALFPFWPSAPARVYAALAHFALK